MQEGSVECHMWKHDETNRSNQKSCPWCILMLLRELLSPAQELLRFYSALVQLQGFLMSLSLDVTCVTPCRLKDQTEELGTFDGAVLAMAPATTAPTSRKEKHGKTHCFTCLKHP